MPQNETPKRGRPRTPWKQYGLQLHPDHAAFLDALARELGTTRSGAARFVVDWARGEVEKTMPNGVGVDGA